jgi:hypothetical protein
MEAGEAVTEVRKHLFTVDDNFHVGGKEVYNGETAQWNANWTAGAVQFTIVDGVTPQLTAVLDFVGFTLFSDAYYKEEMMGTETQRTYYNSDGAKLGSSQTRMDNMGTNTDYDVVDSSDPTMDNWAGQKWTNSWSEGYRFEKAVTLADEPTFLDLNGNGTKSETGVNLTLTEFYESENYFDGSPGSENIMYRSSDGTNLGGYAVSSGYRAVLDGSWEPTGELVGPTGAQLNIFTDFLAMDTWAEMPGMDGMTLQDVITALTSDFDSATTGLLGSVDSPYGFFSEGSNYKLELTGNFFVNGVGGGQSLSGTTTSGFIYKNGEVILDGANKVTLDASALEFLVNALGVFDNIDEDHDDGAHVQPTITSDAGAQKNHDGRNS